MNYIFEVEDLMHATPATVSRLGIIFFEIKSLGWEVIVKSYFL
jgi:dynein heavy chain